jgi:hypothetical protein
MHDHLSRHWVLLALAVSAAGCATEPWSTSTQGATFALQSFSGSRLPFRYDEQGLGTYYEFLADTLVFDGTDSLTHIVAVRHVAAAQALDTIVLSHQRAAYSIVAYWLTVSYPCCSPTDQFCGGPTCPAIDFGRYGSEAFSLYRPWDARRPTLRYTRSTRPLLVASTNH